MSRAVVVFVEDNKHLLMQLGCLYTSVQYVQSEDTDLVVFGTQEALKKVPNDCIKVPYEIASEPQEFLHYRFINSISCLVGPQADFLDRYDFILRTDADTFLTPAWKSFYPAFYTVGQGGYVNDQETRNHLQRIANLFQLRHQGKHNLGSTHYGDARLVRKVCELATNLTAYILTEEFKDGEGQWPGWYRGVATMYACELAANHYVDEITVDPQRIDYGSASTDSIKDHPHIHCWHTNNLFSKFQFTAGNYDNRRNDHLNIEQINEYCLSMALQSKNYIKF